MKINNTLKYLIFCFLLFGLTGCNRVADIRPNCSFKTEEKGSSANPQDDKHAIMEFWEKKPLVRRSEFISNFMGLSEKAFLNEWDKYIAKLLLFFFMYTFDFGFDMPQSSSDSMDTRMPQMMADSMLYMAAPVVKNSLKHQAAELRKTLHNFIVNPDHFINRLTASCQTVSNASDFTSGADMNNNVHFMDSTKKVYLGVIDNYTAKLLLCFFMYTFDFGFDMPQSSSDLMDTRMPQMLAAFMLYVADPVVKLFVKQQVAKFRKLCLDYLAGRDFIDRFSNLEGVFNAPHLGLSIGKSVVGGFVRGINYIKLCVSHATWPTLGTKYNHMHTHKACNTAFYNVAERIKALMRRISLI